MHIIRRPYAKANLLHLLHLYPQTISISLLASEPVTLGWSSQANMVLGRKIKCEGLGMGGDMDLCFATIWLLALKKQLYYSKST
jgi:hypothetical protein